MAIAILLDALAYKRLAAQNKKAPMKGIVLSVVAGVLMGFFYSFVAKSMGAIQMAGGAVTLEAGKLSPYSAIVLFSAGLLLSNFLWNTLVMIKPLQWGSGALWRLFYQRERAAASGGHFRGHDLECGHGVQHYRFQRGRPGLVLRAWTRRHDGRAPCGAWFIWKEFKGAPPGTNKLLAAMFVFYLLGLSILIASKL